MDAMAGLLTVVRCMAMAFSFLPNGSRAMSPSCSAVLRFSTQHTDVGGSVRVASRMGEYAVFNAGDDRRGCKELKDMENMEAA